MTRVLYDRTIIINKIQRCRCRKKNTTVGNRSVPVASKGTPFTSKKSGIKRLLRCLIFLYIQTISVFWSSHFTSPHFHGYKTGRTSPRYVQNSRLFISLILGFSFFPIISHSWIVMEFSFPLSPSYQCFSFGLGLNLEGEHQKKNDGRNRRALGDIGNNQVNLRGIDVVKPNRPITRFLFSFFFISGFAWTELNSWLLLRLLNNFFLFLGFSFSEASVLNWLLKITRFNFTPWFWK